MLELPDTLFTNLPMMPAWISNLEHSAPQTRLEIPAALAYHDLGLHVSGLVTSKGKVAVTSFRSASFRPKRIYYVHSEAETQEPNGTTFISFKSSASMTTSIP